MAAKKHKRRAALTKAQFKKKVLKLEKRARATLVRLLKRDRAGTITRKKLDAGLREAKNYIDSSIFTHRW